MAGMELHASAVARAGRGFLFLGPPGAGKTTLALEMIALGAQLVADDRVRVAPAANGLTLSAPPSLAGLVEVRGAGVLRLAEWTDAPLWLVVDLGRAAGERMPAWQTFELCGVSAPRMFAMGKPGLAATLSVMAGAARLPDPFASAAGEQR